MNRRERRAATYLDSPAYIWAINNDRPQTWAKKLAYAVGMQMRSIHMEKTMGDRLTFSKMKMRIHKVTNDAFLCDVKINQQTNTWATQVWVPRSNIRSDDDKKMNEHREMLDAGSFVFIKTFVHVADWFRDSRKWTAVES